MFILLFYDISAGFCQRAYDNGYIIGPTAGILQVLLFGSVYAIIGIC
jgi:hypothetical protein